MKPASAIIPGLAMALGLCLALSSARADPVLMKATVHVVAANGDNAPKAKVTITSDSGAPPVQLQTGPDGSVTAEVKVGPSGWFSSPTVTIAAEKDSQVGKTIYKVRGQDLKAGPPVEIVRTITLGPPPRAPNIVRLTVTVVDTKGDPVGGANVTVTHDGLGPELLHDYRMETDVNGVAGTDVKIGSRMGEGSLFSPTLIIEVNKESLSGKSSVNIQGSKTTAGFTYPEHVQGRVVVSATDSVSGIPTINVEVSVKDESGAVEGASVSIEGLDTRAATGVTDGRGKAIIPVQFTSPSAKKDYWIMASKQGYIAPEKPGVRISLNRKDVGQTILGEVTLKKGARVEGADITVEVTKEGGMLPVADAHVTFTGTSGTAMGVYPATTDSSGHGRLRIPGYGRFNVTLKQDTFEPKEEQAQIDYGETEKTFKFSMKEKPTGDEVVEVTVLAGDVKNGRGGFEPLRGAIIKAGELSGGTDKDGKASLSLKAGIIETSKGQGYTEAVNVTVSANGYLSQTRSVPIRRSGRNLPGSGAGTFILQPGEEPVSDETPLQLVVTVKERGGTRDVNQAEIKFYQANGTALGSGSKTDYGKVTFRSSEHPGVALAELRKGMSIDIKAAGYKEVLNRSIPAKSLEPSLTPGNFYVELENDWSELEKAIATLEGRVAGWKSEAENVNTKAKAVAALSTKCAAARRRSAALLGELKAARKAADEKRADDGCKEARELERTTEKWRDEAAEKEKLLRSTLDEAIGLAATCNSKAEADAIRAKHKRAIVLTGELGKLEKQARVANERITNLAKNLTDTKPLAQLQQFADKIEEEVSAAGKDAAEADNGFSDALKSSNSLPGRRAEFLQVLNEIKTDHHVREYEEVLPKDLRKRLTNLEAALSPTGNDLSMKTVLPLDRTRLNVIKETVSALQEDKNQAVEIVGDYKTATCDVRPFDYTVNVIGQMVVGATIELGAASDLPDKADACAAKVAATPTPPPPPESDEITVPDFKGYTDPSKMVAVARQAGLKPSLVASNEAPAAEGAGVVVRQSPLPNAKAKPSDPLTIFLNQKKLTLAATPTPTPVAATPTPTPVATATPTPKVGDEVIVPSIPSGVTVAEAKATLSAAGLGAAFNAKGGKPDSEDLEFKTSGVQDPPGGSTRKRGETVTVSIYQKYEPKTSPTPTSAPFPTATAASGTMPDLTGSTLEQAVARLPANMEILSDEIGDKPPTPEKALTIFSQAPAAGTTFDPNNPPIVKVKRYGSAKTAETGSGSFAGTWVGLSLYPAGGDDSSGLSVEMIISQQGSGYVIEVAGVAYPLQSDGTKLWHTVAVPFSKQPPTFGQYDITYRLVGDTLAGDWRLTTPDGTVTSGALTLHRK